MGKEIPHKNSVGVSLGKEREGDCSDELFQFAANSRSEVGSQAYHHGSGAIGGGSASSRNGLARREAGASVENAMAVDGDQYKGGGHPIFISEVRNNPCGDAIGAENTHICNGESVLSKDHACDRGEGIGVGNSGATEGSVYRGRKNIGEDGMDGLEFEEGCEEHGSTD